MNRLKSLSVSPIYWLAFLLLSFSLLAVALYYQYSLDEWPCTLCIHVRLWISLSFIAALLGMVFNRQKLLNFIMHSVLVFSCAGFVERSYQLLGTEKGFIFSSCGFTLDFPSWFSVDQWLPWLYRVESSCGYTPEVLFGITMAESLMFLSVLTLIISFFVGIGSLLLLINKQR